MPLDLGDPRKPVPNWLLRACAKLTRESPDPAEYVGLLLAEPEIGASLILVLDAGQQLTTSKIRRIEPGPEQTLYVHTANSRYWIRRLSQLSARA